MAFRPKSRRTLPPDKIAVQARNMQAGDVVGSGEIVMNVTSGARTPSGKVDVTLKRVRPGGEYIRTSQWGAYNEIIVKRARKDGEYSVGGINDD